MDPKKVQAALDALIAGDSEACASLLKDMIASAAGGGADTGGGDDGAALADNADPPPPKPEDEKAVAASVGAYLRRLTGAKSDAEAVEAFTTATKQIKTFNADRAAFEIAERRTLIAELVKGGFETPATAWSGDPAQQNPCKRLADEPIAEMRERVKALSALPSRKSHTAPESGGEGEDEKIAEQVKALSADVLSKLKAKGMTPEQFIKARSGAVRSS